MTFKVQCEVKSLKEILTIGLSPIGGKREKEAFITLGKNVKLVFDTVKKLEEMITALFEKRNLEEAEALGRGVSFLETRADRGRRDFVRTLHEGAFLPAFRGDLARLAEQIDSVADTAEAAARAILLRDKLIGSIAKAEKKRGRAKSLRMGLVRMAKLTTQTVDRLRSAVEALMTDVDAANRRADEVDKLEHEVDLLEQGLLKDIYGFEKVLDPVSVVQLVEITRMVENITDRAEDASDVIRIVGYLVRV